MGDDGGLTRLYPFFRSIGGVIWAGLGIGVALVGFMSLSKGGGVQPALLIFAFSLFMFLPLVALFRKPTGKRDHPRGTSDISTDWRERELMAGDPATPIDLLDRLAGDSTTAVRCAVATNPATPLWLVERLAVE